MKLRVSNSLQPFEENALLYWGLKKWEGVEDPDQDVLYFGLYTQMDYDTMRIQKGKKTILWGGSDIIRLMQNYDYKRVLNLFPEAEHFCENEVEKKNLENCGVKVKDVIPSFLDNIHNFPVSFEPTDRPHIFMCGHPEREEEYGWGLAEYLAKELPEFTFHLYGVVREKDPSLLESLNEIDTRFPNIIRHGKVSKDQFNKEIRNYHCGFRPNEHDGFSEVTAKSILLGQYPITKIPYDGIWNYNSMEELLQRFRDIKYQDKPNTEARLLYLKKINNFPWCQRKYWEDENGKDKK